jgi:hypothetical protein
MNAAPQERSSREDDGGRVVDQSAQRHDTIDTFSGHHEAGHRSLREFEVRLQLK